MTAKKGPPGPPIAIEGDTFELLLKALLTMLSNAQIQAYAWEMEPALRAALEGDRERVLIEVAGLL